MNYYQYYQMYISSYRSFLLVRCFIELKSIFLSLWQTLLRYIEVHSFLGKLLCKLIFYILNIERRIMQVFQRQSKSTLSTYMSEKSPSLYMQTRKYLLKIPRNPNQQHLTTPSSPLKENTLKQLKLKKESHHIERKSLKLVKQSSVWKSKKGKIENQYTITLPYQQSKDKVFEAFLACQHGQSTLQHIQKVITSKRSSIKQKVAYHHSMQRNKNQLNSKDIEESNKFTINIRDFKKRTGQKSRYNESMNYNVVNLFRSLQQSIKPIHQVETTLPFSNKQNKLSDRLKEDKVQFRACKFVPLKMPSFVGNSHQINGCYFQKISMTEERNQRTFHKASEKHIISNFQYGNKQQKKGISSHDNQNSNQFQVKPWSTHQIMIDL